MSVGLVFGLVNMTTIIVIIGVIMYSFQKQSQLNDGIKTLSTTTEKKFADQDVLEQKRIKDLDSDHMKKVGDVDKLLSDKLVEMDKLNKSSDAALKTEFTSGVEGVSAKVDKNYGEYQQYKTTVNKSLTDLTTQVSSNFTTLDKKISNNFTTLDTAFKGLSAGIETLKSTTIPQSYENMKKEIMKLTEDSNNALKQEYTSAFAQQKTILSTLDQNYQTKFQLLDDVDTKTRETIMLMAQAIDQSLGNISSTNTEQQQKLADLKNSLSSQVDTYNKLTQQATAQAASGLNVATSLQDQLQTVQNNIATIQKQVEGLLGDLNAYKTNNNQNISSMQGQLSTYQTLLDKLTSNLSEQRVSIETLTKQQATNVASVQAQVTDLQNRIQALTPTATGADAPQITNAALQELKDKLAAYQTAISASQVSQDGIIQTLQQKVTLAQEKLNSMEPANAAQFTNFQNQINTLQTSSSDYQKTINASLAAQNTQLVNLSKQLTALEDKVIALGTSTTSSSTLTAIQNSVDGLIQRASTLESSVATLTTNLNALTTRVNALVDFSKGGTMAGNLTVQGNFTATGTVSGAGFDKLKADVLAAVPKVDYSKPITMGSSLTVQGDTSIAGNLVGAGVDKLKSEILTSAKAASTTSTSSPSGDYEVFTFAHQPTAKSDGWNLAGDWPWDPQFRGSRGGYAYNNEYDDQNATSRWIEYAVPAGMRQGYLIHLPWVSCRYFDVWGVNAQGAEVFIRRVNAYQAVRNGAPNSNHDGVTAVSLAGMNRFTKIRIKGVKGRVHVMGIGWTKEEGRAMESGFVHFDNVVGNPDVAYISNVQFNRGHTGFVNDANDRAEIANDTNGYKTLMILGNKSAGMGRRVSVWDRLEVNGTFVNNSDRRVKSNIADLGDAEIDKITELKPSKYTMNSDPTKAVQYGFIAQDVEKVYPNLVSSSGGKEDTKSLNYNSFIPLVVGKMNKVFPKKDTMCIDDVCITKEDLMKLKKQ